MISCFAEQAVHHYPDGSAFVLKEKLAQRYGVSIPQITLGNGSNDILDLLGRVFLTRDDSAIYSQHAFIVYALTVLSQNAQAIVVPAKYYGHDLSAMLAAIQQNTKVIFIANPNNPTGTYCNSDSLYHFMQKVPNHIIVALDEAYFELLENPYQQDHIAWLAEFPNLVIIRTFSKAYGLASLRIGYAISSLEIADLMNRVRQPFNTSTLAQQCAITALAEQSFIEHSRQQMHLAKDYLEKGLQQLGIHFIPSVANFLCVQFANSQYIHDQLAQNGILVRSIAAYQLPNYLRITIAKQEQMERLLNTLQKIVQQSKKTERTI